MSGTFLSFKEMCSKFDVTPRTLRYYEYIELLTPQKQGRNRFYGTREQARMTLILRGRRFGFSLEVIRRFLLIYEEEGTQAQLEAWVEIATDQLTELRRQQDELSAIIDELDGMRLDAIKRLG